MASLSAMIILELKRRKNLKNKKFHFSCDFNENYFWWSNQFFLEHKFSEGYDTSSGASGTTPVTGEGFVIVKNPGSMNGFTVKN